MVPRRKKGNLDPTLAVRVEGLSKVYHPDAKRLHETPVSLSDRLLGRRTAEAEDPDEDEVVDDEDELGYGDVLAEEEAPTEFVWGLRDATFDLPRGEAIAVVGAPGSGKTTLLNLLAGIAPPSAGKASIRGRIWPPLSYLTTFMEPGVTIRQNALIAAKVANVPAKIVGRGVDEIFELLEVSKAGELRATGNRTRAVALAAGLVADADLLLLDDPAVFGGPAFEGAAIAALSTLRDAGATILVEEPDHQLIDSLCDRVIWLDACRLRRFDTKDVLLPEYVAASAQSSRFPQLAWQHGGGAAVRSFSETAAIRAATAEDEATLRVESVGADDTLVLHVVVELAEAPAGIRCGIALTTEDGRQRVWIEQPQAATLQTTGMHDIYAHVRAGDLPSGSYTGHVEAIVSRNRDESTVGRADLFSVNVRDTLPAAATDDGGWSRSQAEWRLSEPIQG